MTAVVELRGIVRRFGVEEVLRGVDLTVEPGELLAIVGRSGSGKSTLLQIIGGLDRRFDGTARVLGRELHRLSDGELSRLRNAELGFVFQSFHLLDHLSCVENVALPALFSTGASALRGAAATARAKEALDRVGIADKADALPGALSGGQRQRVAIARALFHRPRLLLADEPTGNLDSETGRAIIELFGALHRDGLTLVVVTHEERVSSAARRVVRIEDGRVVAEPAPAAPSSARAPTAATSEAEGPPPGASPP